MHLSTIIAINPKAIGMVVVYSFLLWFIIIIIIWLWWWWWWWLVIVYLGDIFAVHGVICSRIIHSFIHSFIHSWHQMGIVSVCHVYLSPLIVTIQQIHWLVDPVNVSPIFPILYSSVPHEIPVCHRHSSNRPDQTFPNFYSHSLFHNVTQSSRLECCFLLSIFFSLPIFCVHFKQDFMFIILSFVFLLLFVVSIIHQTNNFIKNTIESIL